MQLRPFTNRDWDGLAGAERGPGGELPLVAYNDENLVVVDAKGIWVQLYDGDGENDISYTLTLPSVQRAGLVAALLPDVLTHELLIDLGFKKD